MVLKVTTTSGPSDDAPLVGSGKIASEAVNVEVGNGAVAEKLQSAVSSAMAGNGLIASNLKVRLGKFSKIWGRATRVSILN